MPTSIQITSAVSGTTIAPIYSTIRISSVGSKWVLLTHPGGFFELYTGAGAFVRLLPSAINTSSRPVWSRTDPDVLTYLMGNMLESYNAASNVSLTLHVFTEYSTVSDGGGEADLALDNDHRVLSGIGGSALVGTTDVFVWTLSTNTKGPIFPQTQPFDALKISANNHIILSRGLPEAPALPIPGVQYGIWDITANPNVQLLNADGHAEAGVDADATPILLVTNSDENPVTLPNYPNGVVKVRLADGKQTGLMSFPWSAAVDITKPTGGSACYISTYGATDASGNLYRVELDGSSDTLILEGINHAVQTYDGQPRFSVSAEGDRGWFAQTESDGITINTYMVILNQLPIGVRIDYSPYVGKPFTMVPQPDGNIAIQDSTGTRIDYTQYIGNTEFPLVPLASGSVDIYKKTVT